MTDTVTAPATLSDVDDPDLARAIGADHFQRLLTTRNRGVLTAEQQARVGATRVAVLGCGSIGGAAVEPLVRLGFRDLVLADPGSYELSNLNRQNAVVADLGRNKAEVAAERARAINPYVQVTAEPRGVTPETVDALLDDVDVVVDGVDVTTRGGLTAKGLLHARAHAARLPLMTGWDMSGTQYVQVYDYRTGIAVFGGRATPGEMAELPMWGLLRRFIPPHRVPRDMLRIIRAGLTTPDFSFPQLVNAADLFGVLAPTLCLRLAIGQPVPSEVLVDAHRLTSTRRTRLIDDLRRPAEVVGLLRALSRSTPSDAPHPEQAASA